MCGRVIVDYDEIMRVASNSELAAWMTEPPVGARSSWNIKPTQQIPVVLTSAKDDSKRFELAHWSLVPPWAAQLKTRFPTFNARSESVTEKRTFAPAVKQHRCIIPVTGFYEWTGPKGSRVPHAIFGPQAILPLAGLYGWWRGPAASDGESAWHLTATVLTRASAGVMSHLHDRMPVFVSGELLEDWLDPRTTGDRLLVEAVSEASVPLASDLREWAVAPLTGDGPQLLNPV